MSGILTIEFTKSKQLTINLDDKCLDYLFSQIKTNPGTYLKFRVVKRDVLSYGRGATRYAYHHLVNEMLDDDDPLLKVVSTYFIDINKSNVFWQSEDNIKYFAAFISMVVYSGYTLPYHFVPGLLEAFRGSELSLDELKFFMERINPELLSNAEKVKPNEFELLDINYANHNELYRSEVIGDVDDRTKSIYKLIAEGFSSFAVFNDCDAIAVDKKFSGEYHITPEDVIAIAEFDDDSYQDRWNQFVRTLDESELKRMMILIKNTISMKSHYFVQVTNMKFDLRISTCYQEITINEKFFDNDEQMQMLRIYFSDSDDSIRQ